MNKRRDELLNRKFLYAFVKYKYIQKTVINLIVQKSISDH